MAGKRFLLLLTACLAYAAPKAKELFRTSERCMVCHNGLTNSAGEDLSIGSAWRGTMMANSSRDPYWQAGVRREVTDHAESKSLIEDECAACHMPMSRFTSKHGGTKGQVFAHLPFDDGDDKSKLAADGVSCGLCHQISKENLGKRESFNGHFSIDKPDADGLFMEYGPYKIEPGQTRIMRTSTAGFKPTESTHIQQSEVCATCHTLYTKALGPGGKPIGEFPEQMPYQEWLHSEFKDKRSCQSCHMPVIKEPVALTRVLGITREEVSRHTFVGGNFFMLRMLNKYRDELQVAATKPELEASIERTVAHLQTQTAKLSIVNTTLSANSLSIDLDIENLGGHKLPTAYPSRRAWIHLVVRDASKRIVFESGAFNANGSIQGNDNDNDDNKFEPHYTEITTPDQVQIMESIMGDSEGKPTTALLKAIRYLKDNRILPKGFDKQTASQDIAVVGGAKADENFQGGTDRIRYSIALTNTTGPLTIEAEIWFQPISFRWANNLRAYDSPEPKRFVSQYDAMASGSALVVSHATASTAR